MALERVCKHVFIVVYVCTSNSISDFHRSSKLVSAKRFCVIDSLFEIFFKHSTVSSERKNNVYRYLETGFLPFSKK